MATGMAHTRGRIVGRVVGLAVAATAAGLLLSGCGAVGETFDGFGWPQDGLTDQSQRMYDMWVGSVVAALLVGLLVWGLIFWCVVRYRKRDEELPPQTRFNLPMEVLYTVAPFLVIAVLFYHTAVIQTDVMDTSRDPDVVVEVVAMKWNWRFNYQDGMAPGGSTIATTVGTVDEIPVLVLPAGQTVRFELASQDVIHSFWVPELLFKRDVLPGIDDNVFEVTIRAGTEGHYVGRCAELCGTYHSMMNFELRVVDPAQYLTYVDALATGASQAEALGTISDDPFATTTEPFDTRRTQP